MKSLIDSLLRIFVAALLAGATVVAVAADAHGNYTIYGVGNTGCGELMESYDKDTGIYNRAEAWVTGYVTAYGAWATTPKSLGDVAELDGMMLIIRQYCRNNPLSHLGTAAGVMVLQVMEKAYE